MLAEQCDRRFVEYALVLPLTGKQHGIGLFLEVSVDEGTERRKNEHCKECQKVEAGAHTDNEGNAQYQRINEDNQAGAGQNNPYLHQAVAYYRVGHDGRVDQYEDVGIGRQVNSIPHRPVRSAADEADYAGCYGVLDLLAGAPAGAVQAYKHEDKAVDELERPVRKVHAEKGQGDRPEAEIEPRLKPVVEHR